MKLILVVAALGLTFSLNAQGNNDSLNLRKKLDGYMVLTKSKDFDKIMDYMHPSLFEIAPREALIQAMVTAFSNDAITIDFDSVSVIGITPTFTHNNSQYRKVDYFMIMVMKFTDTSVSKNADMKELFMNGMKEEFGNDVVHDEKRDAYIIKTSDILLAIKDQGKEWLFLGYEGDNKLLEKLYPAEVRKHFQLQ